MTYSRIQHRIFILEKGVLNPKKNSRKKFSNPDQISVECLHSPERGPTELKTVPRKKFR